MRSQNVERRVTRVSSISKYKWSTDTSYSLDLIGTTQVIPVTSQPTSLMKRLKTVEQFDTLNGIMLKKEHTHRHTNVW